MKTSRVLILVLAAAAVAYLLLWPVPIQPTAWTPPSAPPLEGSYVANDRLKAVERLAPGIGQGPEGVSLDAQGRLYAGYLDGRVMQFDAQGGNPVELANTGGRPLGTLALPDGGLVVADAAKGLLQVNADRTVTVLSTEAEGVPFAFTDDVDRGRSSPTLYFTDASSRFGYRQVMEDVMEHGANGRLLSYDPASGKTQVLLRDLYFPNGVAVGPDDAYLLVNETTKYRVLRYWLKGERAGQTEIFADNLPGFPDNISFNGKDRFWCALYAPRVKDLDAMLPMPFLRKVVFRLPQWVQPKPVMHGFVLGFDLDGKVAANLQHYAPDAFAPITSAEEHDGWLYLGSLTAPSMARLRLATAQ